MLFVNEQLADSFNVLSTAQEYIPAMDLSEKIGARIKRARHAAGMTLQQLSEATDELISVSRLGNYERGYRRPGIEEAVALSKALGNITAAEILCVDDESTLEPREKTLLKIYRMADDRGKHAITRVAEVMPDYQVDPASSDDK